jgi:CheY-like chemotaxis protein
MVTKNINEWFRKTFRRQKIAPDNGMIKSPNVLSRIMNVTKKNKIHPKNILIKSTSESLLTPSEQQRNRQVVNDPNFSGDRRSPSELVMQRLPLLVGTEVPRSKAHYQVELRPPITTDSEKILKIMIVDDMPSILNFLQKSVRNQIHKIDRYKGVTIQIIPASNCGDAMKKFEEHPDLNLVLLDFDLGISSNCDNETQYSCCDDGKKYPTYFDQGNNDGTHSKHNGIELANQLYNAGYRNTLALQTSVHGKKTTAQEQADINRFLSTKRYEFEITFVDKGNAMFPNLVPLLDRELEKIKKLPTSGGKKHRKRKYANTRRVRRYSIKGS